MTDQLNMQEREVNEKATKQYSPQNTIPGEREKNTDMQAGIYVDKQEAISENKHGFSPPDSGLSSMLGILTPDPGGGNEEQPIKPKKKKKPKQHLGK